MADDEIKRNTIHLPLAQKPASMAQQAQQNQSSPATRPAAKILGRRPLFGR